MYFLTSLSALLIAAVSAAAFCLDRARADEVGDHRQQGREADGDPEPVLDRLPEDSLSWSMVALGLRSGVRFGPSSGRSGDGARVRSRVGRRAGRSADRRPRPACGPSTATRVGSGRPAVAGPATAGGGAGRRPGGGAPGAAACRQAPPAPAGAAPAAFCWPCSRLLELRRLLASTPSRGPPPWDVDLRAVLLGLEQLLVISSSFVLISSAVLGWSSGLRAARRTGSGSRCGSAW